MLVGFDDAPVYAGALTKIIGVDDQVFFSGHALTALDPRRVLPAQSRL